MENQYDPFFEEQPEERPAKKSSPVIVALVVGLIAGIIGSQIPDLLYGKGVSFFAPQKEEMSTQAERVREVIQEDEAVVNLVENSTPGVVSIVISKAVVQNQSPFGGFFFPFGVPQEPSGTGEVQQVGAGSGFFVSADGLVVTNKHVVSDTAATYTVVVSGGEEYAATVLARDPNNDIAVLKVEGNNFPVLPFGDSDAIKVGQTAIAIGNPLGEFANSVSRGIVSGLKRDVTAGSSFGEEEQLSDILQTDAAINPGNSGGPLFNINGEVIGVNVAVAQGAENIGFALPINQVKRIVDQVRETGRISVPYIGVRYVILDDATQKESGLPYNYGALVLRGQTLQDFAVIPGSPADKAGLRENDIILEVNGEQVTQENTLADLISRYKVGDEVMLKVWSQDKTKDVKLRLEERQQ